MKGITVRPSLLLLSALSPLAAAQSLTVSVSEAPFVLNGEVTTLADITISETVPDALQDGYFAIYFAENPDQRLLFEPGSTVSGNAAGMNLVGGPGVSALVVEVDADDGRMDTVTVRPQAVIDFYDESYSFRNGPISIQLTDQPTAWGLIPPGAGTGLGTAQGFYGLGIFGGSGGITIGDGPILELDVGETVLLPVDHGHPGHIIVESFHPGIAEVVSHTLTEVEIRGVAPGEALVQAWNPIGESGYLNVSVSDDTAISPAEQIRLLIGEVESLTPANLRPGLARALVATLRGALRSVEAGRTRAACVQLNAFILEVRALIRLRQLDAVLGNELIAAARAVRDALGC